MVAKNFKLEQVLTFRKEIEKKHKIEFAEAKEELEDACDSLKKSEATIQKLDKECQEKQCAGIDAVELRLYADFSMRKKMEVKIQRQTVASLNRKVEEKREILIDAAKDKKVLEVFKEKTTDALKKELLGKDRAFIDELTAQKKGHHKR